MSGNSTVDGWLAALSPKIGIPALRLGPQAVAAVEDENGLRVVVEARAGSPLVHVYSPLLQLPHGDRTRLYEELLRRNLLCQETAGATFAIDTRAESVVLSLSTPVAHLDALGFENLFLGFLELAGMWRARLEALLVSLDTHAQEPAQDGGPRLWG